ncbi:MAG: hypothetical protein RhofKO_37180 [Rhodothermales bacterium]
MEINTALFHETTHSPSLIDLVGAEQAGQIVDFCFIANPYYPTPEMLTHLVKRLPLLIKTYPSSNPSYSSRPLAEVLGVNPANLIVGNGATELITTLCDNVIDRVGVAVPTFGEYLDKIDPAQVAIYALAPEQNYQLDLDAYFDWLQQQDVNAAIIINPGNPTGQLFSRDAMEAFLQRAAHFDVVIVDESFIDFADEDVPTLLPVADRYPNLVIVRSMSKHCGVPGLRLGYCYANNPLRIRQLRRYLPTWNVNTLAEYFLSLLPRTDDLYHESRIHLLNDVRTLYQNLCDLDGYFAYPTGANFVLIRIDLPLPAMEVQMRLLREHRLYVRDCSNKVGMDTQHLRVAAQGGASDERLIAALRDIATPYLDA